MTGRSKEPAEIRRGRIIALTEEMEFIRPSEIALQLGVSAETVRRDLLALESSGALRRVHGGAMMGSGEPSRLDRASLATAQKNQIARIVAELVEPGETLFMDVGTSIEEAARGLPAAFNGTVVTNSLAVGGILNDRESIELYMIGGRVRVGEMTTFGPDTIAQLSQFNASTCFIGSGGIHLDSGMTDYTMEDVAVKQLMIERSARTYVLATGEKFGVQAKRFVCDLREIAGVITDADAPPAMVAELREAGIVVLTPHEVGTLPT